MRNCAGLLNVLEDWQNREVYDFIKSNLMNLIGEESVRVNLSGLDKIFPILCWISKNNDNRGNNMFFQASEFSDKMLSIESKPRKILGENRIVFTVIFNDTPVAYYNFDYMIWSEDNITYKRMKNDEVFDIYKITEDKKVS